MRKHPAKTKRSKTYFCLAYPRDLQEAYAFYCARYENISFKEFLGLGITEFMMKLSSIPESEPLFTLIKSRIINLSSIKNKDERKYWSDLKRRNKLPSEYLSTEEIMFDLKQFAKEKKI